MAAPTPGGDNGVGTLGLRRRHAVFRSIADSSTRRFQVAITTATPGATIRYTTDGSLPSATRRDGLRRPDQRQQHDDRCGAIAFKAGFTSPNVDTQTYIFLDDVIQQTASDLPPFVPDAVWGHDKDDVDTAHDDADWEMDPDIVNDPTVRRHDQERPEGHPDDVAGDGLGRPVRRHAVAGHAPRQQGIYMHGTSDERPTSLEYFTADGATPVPDRRGDRNSGPLEPDCGGTPTSCRSR